MQKTARHCHHTSLSIRALLSLLLGACSLIHSKTTTSKPSLAKLHLSARGLVRLKAQGPRLLSFRRLLLLLGQQSSEASM